MGVFTKDKISLTLTISDEGFEIENKELVISVQSHDWSWLSVILQAEIHTLWHEYALAPDETLSEDAKELKNKLLLAFEERKT